MKNKLLIIGAGIYSLVVKEIAESMGCFEQIAFIDDRASMTPNGIPVVGTTEDMGRFIDAFDYAVVAIGNPGVRYRLLERIEREGNFRIATLISPHAYVSPSAKIAEGCVIEPMAVVHTEVELGKGCLVSAGAVINHAAKCGAVVHVDCNAVVAGNTTVPDETKVYSCTFYTENKN